MTGLWIAVLLLTGFLLIAGSKIATLEKMLGKRIKEDADRRP